MVGSSRARGMAHTSFKASRSLPRRSGFIAPRGSLPPQRTAACSAALSRSRQVARERAQLREIQRTSNDVAQALGEDEIHAAAGALLVVADQLGGFSQRLLLDGRHQLQLAEQPLSALGQVSRRVAEALTDAQRRDQAQADGFAVREPLEAGLSLDGVADGVSQIENGAQSALARVRADDACLDANAAAHDFGQQIGVARRDTGALALQQLEQLGIPDDGGLHGFGQAAAVAALGL